MGGPQLLQKVQFQRCVPVPVAQKRHCFAPELLGMYGRLCSRKRWKFSELSVSRMERGCIREGIVRIKGNDAYELLAVEAGVHRAQKVPETEAGEGSCKHGAWKQKCTARKSIESRIGIREIYVRGH